MALSAREQAEVDAANKSGRPVAVFVHGLWLLPGSWDEWRRLFEDSGYATVAPDWPGDAESVAAGQGRAGHLRQAEPDRDRRPPGRGRPCAGRAPRDPGSLVRRSAHPDAGRDGTGLRVRGHRRGTGPRRPAAAVLGAQGRLGGALEPRQPGQSRRAHRGPVPLRLRQRGQRRGVPGALREVLRARLRDAAVLRGDRELQPAHAGEGRREEPAARPDAGDLGREGPHRAAGDLEGDLQAAAEERARADRARPDRGPGPLADDRQRLA